MSATTSPNAATVPSLELVRHEQDLELTKQTGVAIRDSASSSEVRYMTVEELIRLNRPHRLRVELLAVWCLLVAGLVGLSQSWGYQHGLRRSHDRQDATISQLETRLESADATVKRLKGDLVTVTSNVNSRMDAIHRISLSDDHTTRQLLDRLKALEASRNDFQTGPPSANLSSQ